MPHLSKKHGCNRKKRTGNNLIEFSLLMPWFFFLFIGVFDFGFYDYSLIALQDGLRVATINASQNSSLAGNSATACTYVLDAMRYLPNIGSSVTTCAASPITVTATYGAAAGPDGGPDTTVSATYTTPQVIPIPGLLAGQYTITRTLQMRLP